MENRESGYEISLSHPVHVYFIGIGGVSMSGLAQILHDKGFPVSGSDRASSQMTDALALLGIEVHIGQARENITEASLPIDVVVYTAAVHEDNAEFAAAKELSLPMLSRAELLGQLMRFYELPVAIAGTHGKTTTTSMLSEILLTAHADPTLSIGGVYPRLNSNIRIGASGILVTEACEYTNSFLHFYPKLSCILNIEADHLDFFHDLEEIRTSFRRFALLTPRDGALVIDSAIDCFERITKDLPCDIITFGLSPSDAYNARDIRFNEKGHPHFYLYRGEEKAVEIRLSVPGQHNVSNALAAIALAERMGIGEADIVKSLHRFRGAERRFQVRGKVAGVTIVDDYAHHPTEITATLAAAKKVPHREVICVFQPHTYTRTKALLKDFAKALSAADHTVLVPIYAAREEDVYGISSLDLQREIEAQGGRCTYLDSFEKVKHFLSENCTKGDLLITMGAGDVVKIADDLLR